MIFFGIKKNVGLCFSKIYPPIIVVTTDNNDAKAFNNEIDDEITLLLKEGNILLK
jgi:hypothetical protein